MRLNRRLIVIPTAVALAAAGCGGSDAPTKAEYAKDINKVCKDQKKKFENLKEPKSLDDISTFAEDIQKTFDDTSTKLEDVKEPSGKAGDQAKEFIAAFKADVDNQVKPKLDAMKQAAEAKQQQKVLAAAQQLQQIETPRTDKLARDLGANECGGGGV
jgi:formate dehydrogenase maturation protein FdhE